MIRAALRLVAVGGVSASLGGCLVLKSQHDELAVEVAKLRKQVAQQDAKTGETIEKADALTQELDAKLKEVEEVLRRNQADIGLRVDNLETDVQELRGQAENADYVASAAKAELVELRGELDSRLHALEEKLNEATNIPESKTELFAEAESQFQKKKYKTARKLLRTYESRYPTDPQLAEVRFKIGLTYYSERDYKSGLGEFYRVIQESPKSSVLLPSCLRTPLALSSVFSIRLVL